MRKVYNRIMMMMVALAATVALTSCEPDDGYYSYVAGTWTAEYAGDSEGEYNLDEYNIDQYSFYDNGTGIYSYYNDYRQWVSVRFEWSDSGRNTLTLWYEDGINDRLYYDFDRVGYLVLSHSPSLMPYTGYRPGR